MSKPIYEILGLTLERAEQIIDELESIELLRLRIERAMSFEGPDRDFAMYLYGAMMVAYWKEAGLP